MTMFDRFLRAFGKEGGSQEPTEAAPAQVSFAGNEPVVAWAASQGYAVTDQTAVGGFSLTGQTREKIWVLKRGPSSRDFIEGDELSARAELGVMGDAAVVIMSRPLKIELEKQAYAIYTDSLQTTVNTSLPEEMRWLAMYEEVVWEGLALEFLERYVVLADEVDHAGAWISAALVESLMQWPAAATAAQAPFMVMTLRGNVYLRMEFTPPDLPTLQHAVVVLQHACESALSNLSAGASA